MAKDRKAPMASQGKPITAFFALANKPPKSLAGTSPNASLSHMSLRSRGGSPQAREESMFSKKSTSTRSGVTSLRWSERDTQLPAATALKRGRTQQLKSPSTNSNRNKAQVRRKNTFETDSEDDANEAVIYVNSPNPQKRKKARLSSPTESFQSSNTRLVPSSQSDEEELPLSETHIKIYTPTVRDAVKGSLLPTPHRDEEDDLVMVVDNYTIVNLESQDEVLNVAQSLQPSSQSQMLTPPSSDLPSVPPTPVAQQNTMDRTTKDVIDEIKARAYAKSLSSPEYDEVDFKELVSSDDELFPDLLLPALKLNSSENEKQNPGPSHTDRRSTRHTLRNPPVRPARLPLLGQAQPAKRVIDPFAALLREKKQAEKSGTGSGFIISQAEKAIAQHGKAYLIDEMDGEEGLDSEEWVATSSVSIRDILNSRPQRRDDDDMNLEDEDREKLLEEDGGKTVLEILEQDIAERRSAGSCEKTPGIQLWTTTTDSKSSPMAVDQRHQIPGRSTFIQLLNRSFELDDPARAISLLSMDLMMTIEPADRAVAATALCGIALSTPPSLLADAVVGTLEKCWSSTMSPASSTISFQDLLSCLIHLGFEPSLIDVNGWRNDEVKFHINLCDRGVVLHRLVVLVATCARSGRLRQAELPDMIAALMLLGMGSETQPDLYRDIVEAIDLSMRGLSPDESISRQNELSFSKKVLNMAAAYPPVNKLRLLSLLSNGSGPTRRIANFVAHCIVTDKESPTLEMYMDVPPLLPILEQLEPYSKSSGNPPGKFALYDSTDYVNLGFYIAILGIAVSNLKGHVAQERQRPKPGAVPDSPGKVGDKPKTELQLLHAALEALHSKILDSRAAHLERSRTKAAVKQLSMNIHYQRENWMRNSQDSRSKTLAQYFKKS